MKPYVLKYLALAVGLTSVLVSVVYGNEDTRFIKPVFHILLFSFYSLSTKKWNGTLALFLGSAMIGEYFAAADFEQNFNYIAPLFAIFFTTGIVLLRPVLAATSVRLKWIDIFVGFIAVAGLLYIIALVFILSVNEMKDFSLITLGAVPFCIFIFSCFYVAAFSKHPKLLFAFITGAGYTLVCLGTFIHELLSGSTLLIGTVNAAEIIAQFSFVYFVIHIKEKFNSYNWLV